MEILAGVEKRYIRTLEEVKAVVNYAKLKESDLKQFTQPLYFSEKFEEIRLVELNTSVLDAINNGQRVVFRGGNDDKVVMCTDNETFEVKEAETSNSLLIVSNLVLPTDIKECENGHIMEHKEILGIHHAYYELRPIKPRLKKLWMLLDASRYRGHELEYLLEESSIKLYNMDSLLEEIQASNKEIECGLREIGACCLDGYWRILDFDYCFRVLSYFLNLLDENSWSVSKVPVKEVIESLKDIVPIPILEHVISEFSHPAQIHDDNGDVYYTLNENKVCRFLAEALLRPAGRFNLQDFLQTWQESVPEGLQTNLSQLKGLALVDFDSRPQVIWYYPETDLPEDINERVQSLFRTREKWTLNEIEPYIERLTTDKLNVNAILTKYTRASNINGQRFYSARHGR